MPLIEISAVSTPNISASVHNAAVQFKTDNLVGGSVIKLLWLISN